MKTGLYDFHIAHQAKMVPFAGYSMPLSYGNVGQSDFAQCRSVDISQLTEAPYSVVASHNHVRHSVGIFDVGHMVQSK